MGNKGSKLPEYVEDKFTENELEQIKETYEELSRTRKMKHNIDRETFKSKFFKGYPELSERLFAAFDTNNSGSIDLFEFAIGCAMCSRGTGEEKMSFLFRMFDLDRNGYIDKKEMTKMLQSGFFNAAQMTGSGSKLENVDTRINRLVTEAFEAFDVNHDGKLSEGEFNMWAKTSYEVSLLLEKMENFSLRGTDGGSITGPSNVQHETHVGYNRETGGFEIRNLPPDWIELFKSAGIKRKELQDPETALFLIGVVAKNVPPPPPPPPGPTADSSTPSRPPPLPPKEETEASTKTPVAPPPPPASTPSHETKAGNSGLLGEIQKGHQLKHVEQETKPTDTTGNLLSEIKQGKKLNHIDPTSIKLNNLKSEEKDELTSVLVKAINSRRKFVKEDNQDPDSDHDDWDDDW